MTEAMTKSSGDIVVCDACPVLCRIRPGKTGACDRYANVEGVLTRTDPMVLAEASDVLVPFLGEEWDGNPLPDAPTFLTGIGSGTTYPDYKPAPFIVASRHRGVDVITVVTEAIFSYCGVKVKIDTDRYVGPEQAAVRAAGEQVGHVTTAEYGSQMLALGGVRHLTGGSKKEGTVTCDTLLALCNKQAVDLTVDGGAALTVQAGAAPIVDGMREERMRVGCGSATIGMFAQQWHGHVDEVIVVDDHITGVLSEHQAGRFLGISPSGIRVRGHKSTPGRYFRVAEPGTGWGGTDITDPLTIIERIDAEAVRRVVERIGENCEPALTSVLFMAGAGGSLRAGVTENPVRLTRSVKDALVRVTSGGAPVYVWPGGGITFMVDVAAMPDNAFGFVPTPAIVGPIEFTMRRADYAAMGGHVERVRELADIKRSQRMRREVLRQSDPWPHPWPPALISDPDESVGG